MANRRTGHRGPDGAFRDVGFTAGEARSLRIRADLMISLARMIEDRGLTQAAAARLMSVSQPRVSDLVRGKIELFSIDTLIDMIFKAGGSVNVTVRRSRRAA